jgi:hypothetical protein
MSAVWKQLWMQRLLLAKWGAIRSRPLGINSGSTTSRKRVCGNILRRHSLTLTGIRWFVLTRVVVQPIYASSATRIICSDTPCACIAQCVLNSYPRKVCCVVLVVAFICVCVAMRASSSTGTSIIRMIVSVIRLLRARAWTRAANLHVSSGSLPTVSLWFWLRTVKFPSLFLFGRMSCNTTLEL